MLKTGTLLIVLAITAMLAAPAAAEDEKPDWGALLTEKAESVVAVKFVFNVKVMHQGNVVQDVEQNAEPRATLINDKGLIMGANSAFTPNLRHQNPQITFEVGAPRNLRVLFANEEKEYDAQIVAKDSKLDLVFLQITNLGDRKINCVDLAGENEPSIGQELFTVSRLARAFDNAPALGRLYVTSNVEKPRRMWGISGSVGGAGVPVFDHSGQPVGVISMQSGAAGVSGQGGQARPFILPLKTLKAQLKMAGERAEKALEEAAEKAEEAAEDGEGDPIEEEAKPEIEEKKPEEAPEKPAEEKPAEEPADEPEKTE